MKNACVIVTLSCLMSACAVAPPQVAARIEPMAQAQAGEFGADADADAAGDDATLPKVKLTR
ncbi:MAG: hypothetical protein WKG03_21260, partial [Telluria sp.]